MRPLYEQAVREQQQLADRVRAVRGSEVLAADFERWATALEQLARPAQIARGLRRASQQARWARRRQMAGSATGYATGVAQIAFARVRPPPGRRWRFCSAAVSP